MIGFLERVFQLYQDRLSFFADLIVEHMALSGIVILLSTLIGILLGILIIDNKKAASGVLGAVNILYTIPSVALFGLLIPFVGLGTKNAIIALTLYGLLPVVRNTYIGITQVDADILEAAKGMGSTPLQILIRIKFPLALPVIFTGFRTMVVMTIALASIASFIGADGLGKAVWRGITTNYQEMTFAGSLLIALLAGGSDAALGLVEKYLYRKILGRTST